MKLVVNPPNNTTMRTGKPVQRLCLAWMDVKSAPDATTNIAVSFSDR